MADIKAIPTRYKGTHFRSRSEARTAVFMDACNIQWRYEFEGFNLGNHGLYLPDFWIPIPWCPKKVVPGPTDNGYWLEIKPRDAPKTEVAMWKALVELTGHSMLVFNADFLHPKMMKLTKGRKSCILAPESQSDEHVFEWFISQICRLHGDVTKTEPAINAARSARFEHGQSGAT